MITMFLISMCGISIGFAGIFLVYFMSNFSDVIGLIFLEYRVLIYAIFALIFSVWHGYCSAKKLEKYHWLAAVINGAVLAVPLLFAKNSFAVVAVFVLTMGLSMFIAYAYIPIISYQKKLAEEKYNITDPTDYALMMKLISDIEQDEHEDSE